MDSVRKFERKTAPGKQILLSFDDGMVIFTVIPKPSQNTAGIWIQNVSMDFRGGTMHVTKVNTTTLRV